MLDDSHFKSAGLSADQLHGYYLTEDDGRLLRVFPGSERLRYVDPVRRAAGDDRLSGQRRAASSERRGGVRRRRREVRRLAGDEANVYDRGWLRQFFDLLVANQSWIQDGHAVGGDRQRAAGRQDLSCPRAAIAR